MTKPARRHHYLPESYLAGFTASGRKDDFLYVFDLESDDGQVEKRRPRNVAFQNDYHRLDWPGLPPDHLEKSFFAELEDKLAPALQRVRQCEDVSSEDIDSLLQLVALCAVRVPPMRQAQMKMLENDTGCSLEEALAKDDAWRLVLDWSARNNLRIENTLQALLRRPDLHAARSQYWIFVNTMMYQDTALRQLSKRNWGLYVAPEDDAHFICSDSPFAIHHVPAVMPYRTPKFDDLDTEATFPVSRRTALIGTFDSEDYVRDVGVKAMARTNLGAMKNATRFLYSSAEDFVWMGPDGQLLDWAACFDLRQRCKRGERPSYIPPEYFEGI